MEVLLLGHLQEGKLLSVGTNWALWDLPAEEALLW